MNEVMLGALVRDRITTFSGILVAKSVHIDGTTQLGIQSKELFEGKPLPVQWFDSERILGAE